MTDHKLLPTGKHENRKEEVKGGSLARSDLSLRVWGDVSPSPGKVIPRVDSQ